MSKRYTKERTSIRSGGYDLYKVETPRGSVIVENISGLWNPQLYKEYRDIIEKKLKPARNWVKFVDMSDYNISNVVPIVADHYKWCAAHGLKEVVCVLPSKSKNTTKGQLSLATKTEKLDLHGKKDLYGNNTEVYIKYFYHRPVALSYLASKGYRI